MAKVSCPQSLQDGLWGRQPYLAYAQQQGAEVHTIQGDVGQRGPGQGCQSGQ